MPSSQVQPLPLPQGPPSLVKGSRASGSADEVLVIALAALVYNKRCGGADDHGRSLHGSLEDLMAAVETASTSYVAGGAVWPTPPAWRGTDQWVVDYTPQRHSRARALACAHAHAGGVSRSAGAMGGPSSARGGGGGARSLGRSRARGVSLVMAVGVPPVSGPARPP